MFERQFLSDSRVKKKSGIFCHLFKKIKKLPQLSVLVIVFRFQTV